MVHMSEFNDVERASCLIESSRVHKFTHCLIEITIIHWPKWCPKNLGLEFEHQSLAFQKVS